MTEPLVTARWDPYLLYAGRDVPEHWQARFDQGAKVALVMGAGFDPRMCLVLELFRKLAPTEALAIFAVRFDRPGDVIARAMADENQAAFEQLVGDQPVANLPVKGGELDALARSAAQAVSSLDQLPDATDIVVDINALPRTVFFPLVAKLLHLCDARGPVAPNLHIIAGDTAALDAEMRTVGLDENASWLHPFEGTFSVEATTLVPRVWMPILGENTGLQLERISELVKPQEVCPVLPFPAKDPRRGDRLFDAYHTVLFDQLRTDSGTVIYGDEANPFQVYRRLRESAVWYERTLSPLGGCKTAFSALSSKLVAVGALLAAYELRDQIEVGVADIGGQMHELQRRITIDEAREQADLVSLTLSGDSYL